MSEPIIALCTCPDDTSARRIAEALVTEQLAACVNQIPGVRSTYRWQGALQTDLEVQLVIKTTQNQMATLAERLKDLHPYQLPELVAIPVIGGSAAYLQWIKENVGAGR